MPETVTWDTAAYFKIEKDEDRRKKNLQTKLLDKYLLKLRKAPKSCRDLLHAESN